MSYQNYIDAISLMEKHQEMSDFIGKQSIELLRKAEQILQVRFPSLYRQFLLTYGAGSFGSFEIYGLINDNFIKASIPNGIWLTLKERNTGSIPQNYIIISEDGMGGFYCFEASEDVTREPEIFVVEPGEGVKIKEYIAEDFGEFLLQHVQRELEEYEDL